MWPAGHPPATPPPSMTSTPPETRRLVHAAVGAGVQNFLYVSSLAAHGPTRDRLPAATDAVAHPITPYGASKAAGEEAVLAFANRMSVQVLRPPVVYGPQDRGLLPFFQTARRGFMPLYGNGRNLVSFIHGRDLAEAAVSLLGHDATPPAVFHAADAEGPYTWRQLSAALSVAVDRRVRALPVPGPVYRLLARGSEMLARLRRTDPLLDRSRVREMGEPAWGLRLGVADRSHGLDPAYRPRRWSARDGGVVSRAWLDLMPAGSRPLISFDLDGVLVRPPFGWNPAMRRYAQISPDYVGARTSAPHAPTRWDRVLGATYYRARYARRRLMPGAREALEAAAGRYRVVVLSARSARGRAQTEAWLRRQGFLSYVEGVVLTTPGCSPLTTNSARYAALALSGTLMMTSLPPCCWRGPGWRWTWWIGRAIVGCRCHPA